MTDSELYLQKLESAILHAATTGSPESSHQLDSERCQSPDGLAGACLELLRRRGWGATAAAPTTAASAVVDAASSNCEQRGSPPKPIVAQHDAVAFYALTTLQRSPLLSCLPPDNGNNFLALRNQLRHVLLATISHVYNVQSMPNFVAIKIGVLLALLVREEYPVAWACPWRDVLVALNLSSPTSNGHNDAVTPGKMACMGLYISFLDAVSDEIVYPAADDTDGSRPNVQRERLRREQVKDSLRGYTMQQQPNTTQHTDSLSEPSIPFEHTDAANIVGWLLNVLTITSQNFTSGNEEVLAIAVHAVAALKRYLSWIDLRLAMNQNLLHVVLMFLGGASPPSSDGDEDPTQMTLLAVECAHCLREIVDRGMEDQKKLALLAELNIFGTLCRLSQLECARSDVAVAGKVGKLDLVNLDGTQVEAVAAAAELINTAGLALIQGWELDPTSQQTNFQMEQCLELVLACLAYDSIDVSGAVVDLVSRILVSFEKKEGCWMKSSTAANNNGDDTICNKIISRILLILRARGKYPDDFGFDWEDEEDAEEEQYRTNLRKLYQRIVRLRPQIALRFVGQCLSNLPQPLSSSPTSDIESSLRLVYHYGEGRRPAPGAKTALKDGPFRDMIIALHRSDVSSHPHREVLLLYYDLSVRYSALLKEMPELLAVLLSSISGNHGLQHPHTRVRCRCSYLLLRLVKLVGAKAMRPHVEVVVDGCQRLLFPPEQSGILTIPANEALYLFEATGILLGNSGLDTTVQVRCATAVLTPHIRSIEQTLQSPDLTRDIETYGEQLSMSISAIAQLSKGWQKHPPPEVQTVLAAAVDVCRLVLVALPSSPLIRNRTSVLLQRMILCLGEGILPTMPSFFGPLLTNCSFEDDILDVSQLINQLCIKFKEKAASSVDSAILPFLQKVLAIQLTATSVAPGGLNGDTNGISPPPHLITEQLSIRKQAFATLQHIAVHNVGAVLYSETNVASLGDILQLMNDGATTVPDPIMNKTCAQFFCELIEQWGTGDGHHSPPAQVTNSFFEFIYGAFVPGMIRYVLGTSFNVKDALYCRVLAEFGRALWLLKQSCRGNAEFNSRVIDLHVLGGNGSGTKGSTHVANGFQCAACGKDFESMLKAWKEELRGQ